MSLVRGASAPLSWHGSSHERATEFRFSMLLWYGRTNRWLPLNPRTNSLGFDPPVLTKRTDSTANLGAPARRAENCSVRSDSTLISSCAGAAEPAIGGTPPKRVPFAALGPDAGAERWYGQVRNPCEDAFQIQKTKLLHSYGAGELFSPAPATYVRQLPG